MPEDKAYYAVVHVFKEAEEDDFKNGVCGNRICTMSGPCPFGITGPTLASVLVAIRNSYGIELDYAATFNADGGIFETTELETEDCHPPSESQKMAWQAGKIKLYHCVYTFHVERMTVSEITEAEFEEACKEANVKHDH